MSDAATTESTTPTSEAATSCSGFKASNFVSLPGEKRISELLNILKHRSHSHITVIVKKENGAYVVRKAYPREFYERTALINDRILLRLNHPNYIIPISSTAYADNSVRTEEQFLDAGDLELYINIIKTKASSSPSELKYHQIQFCKSVARQLLEYCVWLHTVVKSPHRNISPKTILFNRSGNIKLKLYDSVTELMVKHNPLYFTRSCAYVAPEYRNCDPETRVDADCANDIWAVGAILYAIMKGETMLPQTNYVEVYHPSVALLIQSDLIQQPSKLPVNEKFEDFDKFVHGATREDWNQLFGDDGLARAARECLQIDKTKRCNALELLSYISLVGGLAKNMRHNVPDQNGDSDDDQTNLVVSLPRCPYERIVHQGSTVGWKFSCDASSVFDAWRTDAARINGAGSHEVIRIIERHSIEESNKRYSAKTKATAPILQAALKHRLKDPSCVLFVQTTNYFAYFSLARSMSYLRDGFLDSDYFKKKNKNQPYFNPSPFGASGGFPDIQLVNKFSTTIPIREEQSKVPIRRSDSRSHAATTSRSRSSVHDKRG